MESGNTQTKYHSLCYHNVRLYSGQMAKWQNFRNLNIPIGTQIRRDSPSEAPIQAVVQKAGCQRLDFGPLISIRQRIVKNKPKIVSLAKSDWSASIARDSNIYCLHS